jgi:hypothetical protein
LSVGDEVVLSAENTNNNGTWYLQYTAIERSGVLMATVDANSNVLPPNLPFQVERERTECFVSGGEVTSIRVSAGQESEVLGTGQTAVVAGMMVVNNGSFWWPECPSCADLPTGFEPSLGACRVSPPPVGDAASPSDASDAAQESDAPVDATADAAPPQDASDAGESGP